MALASSQSEVLWLPTGNSTTSDAPMETISHGRSKSVGPAPTRTYQVDVRNRFQGLTVEEEGKLSSDETETRPRVTPVERAPRKRQSKSTLSTRSASADNLPDDWKGSLTKIKALNKAAVTRTLEQPYQPSYFLPGRVHQVQIQFLINTGCNMNLLS